MGRTGSLREYLSSVSTTIANNSGDKTKDPFDALKAYIGNKNNIQAFTIIDSEGHMETVPYDGEDEITVPGVTSPLSDKRLYFKNGASIQLNALSPVFLYYKGVNSIGIVPLENGEGFTCVSSNEPNYGWNITFLLDSAG